MHRSVTQLLLAALCVVATAVAAYFLFYLLVLLPIAVGVADEFGVRVVYWIIRKPAGLCLVAVSLLIPVYWISWKRLKRPIFMSITAGVPAVMVLFLGLSPFHRRGPNRVGLVSFEPNTNVVQTFAHDKRKDNYPTCTFHYNSLGYRDQEPAFSPRSAQHRVLVIGDSYVWGDGIPTDDQTLGALLRKALAGKPGEYMVVSAAYPGLGVYGYARFLERLKPLVQPDIVVIGFLGWPDFDPFDSQYLIEQVPRFFFFRNIVLNLRVLRRIHEVSHLKRDSLWILDPSMRRVKRAFWKLVEYQRQGNIRIIVVDYYDYRNEPVVPREMEWMELPKRLKHPVGRNQYWYAKDTHPKPSLNRELARLLASRIRELTAGKKPNPVSGAE